MKPKTSKHDASNLVARESISTKAWLSSVMLALCGTALWSSAMAATGLSQADTNNDGQISRAEADAAQDKAFERLDTSGDGQLDLDEFDAGQPRLPDDADNGDEKRRHRIVARWFSHMDTNDDDTISQLEYREALTPYFDRLDNNGDGTISAEELRKALGSARPTS